MNTHKRKLNIVEAELIKIRPYQRQILLGKMLGDGSLKTKIPPYANVRFQMRHSEAQLEWFNWICDQLKTLLSPHFKQRQNPDGFSKNHKWHMNTRALPCLTTLYNELYTNGKLDVSKPWLQNVDEVSLMVWWLDDGGLLGPTVRKGQLHTQGFGQEGTQILKQFLKQKWHIDCSIQEYKQKGKTYFKLQLEAVALNKLFDIIMPLVPVKSMVYKCFLVYDNLANQQDWIDKMKEAMPNFHDEINRLAIKYSKFQKGKSKLKSLSNDIVQ